MTAQRLDTEGAGLTPASQDELRQTIEYSLSFDSSGKASNDAKGIAIKVLAGRILEQLERSNYVIMKGPPGKAWSTPGKARIPMKD